MEGIETRRFPIQRAGSVSWEIAEKAYETYTRYFGRFQSLERLAERGGFGVAEFCLLYLDRDPTKRNDQLLEIVARVANRLGDAWEFPNE